METLDGAAVREVAEIAQQAQAAGERIVEIDERTFSTTQLHEIRPVALEEPGTLKIHTLTGLADYLSDNRDALEREKLTIHIVGPDVVDLISNLQGPRLQRFTYLAARATGRMAGFEFGRFYAAEEMLISLQALFEDRGDRAEVLRLLGNVKDEAVKTSKDDGVSQEVHVRAGVVLDELERVPNPVALAPFRSFPEIDQPESPFVFRVRKDASRGITAALFEADGGAWRLAAISRIHDWLDSEIEGPGVAVIA